MWTFDNFPIARVNQLYGTQIDQAWLDRVRLSSVKFGGCSAGLVSGEGLSWVQPGETFRAVFSVGIEEPGSARA